MKYHSKDETFQVRQVTADEVGGAVYSPSEGEFRVTVSPVANGWWTRAELTALHARIGAALAMPTPGVVLDPDRS